MDRFTKQELVILGKLNSGETNQKIADSLFISLSTVKNHIYRIKQKIGCETHIQMMLFYQKKLAEMKVYK